MGSVGNAPSKNSEDPALFTLSIFLWAKRSSAREKKNAVLAADGDGRGGAHARAPACRLGRAEVTISGHSGRCPTCSETPLQTSAAQSGVDWLP
eukprot:scaffold53026_cov63-Phaeocystis_antarctica.AAC.2